MRLTVATFCYTVWVTLGSLSSDILSNKKHITTYPGGKNPRIRYIPYFFVSNLILCLTLRGSHHGSKPHATVTR